MLNQNLVYFIKIERKKLFIYQQINHIKIEINHYIVLTNKGNRNKHDKDSC